MACVLPPVAPAAAASWSDVLRSDSARAVNAASPAAPALAGSRPSFLPADQAFDYLISHKATAQGALLQVQFRVTPGYYLYQNRFRFSSTDRQLRFGTPSYSISPVTEDDPEFGKVAVFDQDVTVSVPVRGNGLIQIGYQGCAKAGLCYPPQRVSHRISGNANIAATRPPAAATTAPVTENSGDLFGRSPLVDGNSKLVQGLDVPTQTSNRETAVRSQPAGRGEAAPIGPVLGTSVPQPPPLIAGSLDDRLNMAAHEAAIHGLVLGLGRLPEQVSGLPFELTTGAGLSGSLAAPALPAATNLTPAQEENGIVLTARNTAAVNAASEQAELFPLRQHFWLALLSLFGLGLVMSLTPCVWPMLPIVANLVARRQEQLNWQRGLGLATAYAIGVACSYAVLGALAGAFGQQFNLITWLQQPGVLLGFAAFYVLMGLASFEVFQLRLPGALSGRASNFFDRLSQQGQQGKWAGRTTGAWITGFFSALVVSPCISVPLAGALAAVVATGSPVIGAAALFVFGFGLSVPVMILGASEGHWLPRAGAWMHWVRQGFGLMLLGVALVLIDRVWQHPLLLVVVALWLFGLTVWLMQWKSRGRLLALALALLTAATGLLQLAGAATGSRNPYRPLSHLSDQSGAIKPLATVHSIAQLKSLQQQHPRLLVDVTADWCIACKTNERNLFEQASPALRNELTSLPRVMLDVTDTTAQSNDALRRLGLFGPPALILYRGAQETDRLLGEPTQTDLMTALTHNRQLGQ